MLNMGLENHIGIVFSSPSGFTLLHPKLPFATQSYVYLHNRLVFNQEQLIVRSFNYIGLFYIHACIYTYMYILEALRKGLGPLLSFDL